jgi:hypothetical protein
MMTSLYTPDSQTKIPDGADAIMPHLKCEQILSKLCFLIKKLKLKKIKSNPRGTYQDVFAFEVPMRNGRLALKQKHSRS